MRVNKVGLVDADDRIPPHVLHPHTHTHTHTHIIIHSTHEVDEVGLIEAEIRPYFLFRQRLGLI